jgi:hypothetical protein
METSKLVFPKESWRDLDCRGRNVDHVSLFGGEKKTDDSSDGCGFFRSQSMHMSDTNPQNVLLNVRECRDIISFIGNVESREAHP